jgi:hypothetical protein
LHKLSSVTIEDLTHIEIRQCLDARLPSFQSLSQEQKKFIAAAGDQYGKIGFMVVLSRCFEGEPRRASDDRVFDTKTARLGIQTWLEQALSPMGKDDFEQRIVPVLILASYGIPIPLNYDQDYLPRLAQLGILAPLAEDEKGSHSLLARDISLAVVVAQQYRGHTGEVVQQYLEKHPHDLAAVASSLVNSPLGKGVLRTIVVNSDTEIVTLLRELFATNRASFNIALGAIRQATRDHARHLLRTIAAPHGQVSRAFAEAVLDFEGPNPVQAATGTLALVVELDRELLQIAFSALVGRHELNSIGYRLIELAVSNLAAPSVTLFDALTFTLALRRCHFILGNAVFDAFVHGAAYKDKGARLLSPIERIPELIRCGGPLRRLSHKVFFAYAAHYLKPSQVERAIMLMTDPDSTVALLRNLRRIHPRLAIDVLQNRWRTRPDWFSQALLRAPDVVTAVNLLRALANIDRRVAIGLGVGNSQFLCHLVTKEGNHHRLAWALGVIRPLSPPLAEEMARHIDAAWLTNKLNAEQHRIALVGRPFQFLGILRRSCDPGGQSSRN